MTVPVQLNRIAAIDWMQGFVMIIMVLDHVSMAYNSYHLAKRFFRKLYCWYEDTCD
jgi:uncharacterized membrane protein